MRTRMHASPKIVGLTAGLYFMAKSGAQTLTFKSVTGKQTDKQTDRQKNSTFLATPAAGEIPADQTWHGDRAPRARSCTSETFGVWRIVLPLGSAENLGVTRPTPEMGYKFCKFCENRASDTPLRCVYIPHFVQI